MQKLIYSVEDDQDIALIINKTLTKQGYLVKTFYDGKSFLQAFKKEKPQLILLDLMLPDMSGSEILKEVRSDYLNDEIQVIVISAKHLITDKVENLDLGADDYIEKPFDLLELMARVDAKMRRIDAKTVLQVGPLALDSRQRKVTKDGKNIELTNKEFDILAALMKHSPNVITREQLFGIIWKVEQAFESRTLDVHIKSLRDKLGDDGTLIKTVYGVGYQI
ncbi:MAG: response regulator transcription factor [Bacilli bacterium]